MESFLLFYGLKILNMLNATFSKKKKVYDVFWWIINSKHPYPYLLVEYNNVSDSANKQSKFEKRISEIKMKLTSIVIAVMG